MRREKSRFGCPRRRGRGLRLARTFVPDLLEELFNRCVSRFIFHDDQNLRRGIARGRQNRLSWGVPIGRGKSRPLRWKLSKLPPFGCRSENGRGIAPRRDPSRATHLEAFRELWSNRPDEILGRRARMHHAGLHLSRVSGSASDSPPPLPVDSQPAKEPPGRSLLGSLRGGTKPATARIRLAKGLWWETARVDRSVDLACALGARMPRASSSTVFSFGSSSVSEIYRS